MPIATTVDGTRIAYQVSGGGEPLVLLAGQANNHHWWDGVRSDFEPHLQVITVDYRGTGSSDSPRTGYSTRQFARDVVGVLDAAGIDTAHVYGTSMGGRVAQWIAIDHQERVRSLILGCTSPGGPHAHERAADIRHTLASADQDAVRTALIDLMYTPAWQHDHAGPYHVLGDPEMSPFARNAHLVASNSHDAWNELAQIATPTLILHGDEDLLSPVDNAHLLEERIPDTQVVILPGARHAYFDEFRQQASPAAIEFIRWCSTR
ncbi:alpha/beta fold hydrolase [Rhodococcus opacus]|uniref:Putative hydrolase n=1 Tax=Rhodococcus opacus (strain B4) TaxID=632772 RepID=C1B6M3_RHOOB|nr:alpha/beta fold hydrolase [Rhodococcus opacus]BAH51326.1 putative hydrolase [Rhodococcus opacus B4]